VLEALDEICHVAAQTAARALHPVGEVCRVHYVPAVPVIFSRHGAARITRNCRRRTRAVLASLRP
jgi:hypothetical protein